MATRPVNSSTPDSFIYEQILSPLALALASGLYNAFCALSDELVQFAKAHDILVYDQTLAGQFIDYLSTLENLPDESPQYMYYCRIVDMIYDYYEGLVDVNANAASGLYITPIGVRGGLTYDAEMSTHANNICKEVVVSCAPVMESVVEIGGSNGTSLEALARVGVENINYTVYGPTDSKDGISLEMNLRRVQRKYPGFAPNVKFVHGEVDDVTFLGRAHHYFSYHSSYNLADSTMKFLWDVPFMGTVHVNDLCFLDSPHMSDGHCSLTYADGTLNGLIGKYNVKNEPVVYLRDYSAIYPARFLNPLRTVIRDSPYISKSLCFFHNRLAVVSGDVAPQKGTEFLLRPCQDNYGAKRKKKHTIDNDDFYFYRSLGYYVSGNVDGVPGYLALRSGLYTLSFSDGACYTLHTVDNRPLSMGPIADTLNVTVVYNPSTCLFQIWFDYESPKHYPADPSQRPSYWRSLMTSFSSRLNSYKENYFHLFFKRYYWVPPDETRTLKYELTDSLNVNGVSVYFDGVDFDDVFGNHASIWRPWRVATVRVDKNGDKLTTLLDGTEYVVIDEDCYFTVNGMYDVVCDDGAMHLVTRRVDLCTVVRPGLTRPAEFEYDGTKVRIDNVVVTLVNRSLSEYLLNLRTHYDAIMQLVYHINLDPDSVMTLFGQFRARLEACNSYEGLYLSSDFINSIQSVTTYDPVKIWNTFLKHRLLPPGCTPYNPIMKDVGSIRAFVKIS